MTESDQTWNAGDPEGQDPETPEVNSGASHPGESHPDFSWPQYTWPTAPPAPSAPPAPDSGSISWPPTQPTPAAETTAPYATGPYSGGPYSAAPYSSGGGVWGAPPSGWTPAAPPASWPPVAPAPTKARRGLALLAALALVLASAGVGAGVAIAVHNNNDTQTFADGNNGSANNGFGGNGGFNGNGGFGGTLPGGTTGTVPSGSGALNAAAIAGKLDPALVDVNTTLAQGRAAGTGMLISSDGEILTNNHVIADATSIKVTVGGTGSTYDAKVVGYDVTEDVALIKITDKVSNLPTVTFGDAAKVQIGDPVVAIGNALGRGGTFAYSQGHVTKLGQQVTAGDEGGNQETLEGMIQINAPIQPGDSGGALVDASGAVIGMNTAAAGGGNFNSQTGSNIGFAIPIDHAVSILSAIHAGKETDKVHIGDRALLGVQVQDIAGQTTPVDSGALVVGVQDNTGAQNAGIKTNDVVVALDGKPVTDSASLRSLLVKFHPGESVKVGWVDASGTRHDASVKLIVGPPL